MCNVCVCVCVFFFHHLKWHMLFLRREKFARKFLYIILGSKTEIVISKFDEEIPSIYDNGGTSLYWTVL